MGKYLAVAFGGALGAMARFWLGGLVSERFPAGFPLGTLVINVTGSFIVGFFLTLVTERINLHPHWRLAIAVGFVGAYTTFSTFEYETFKLLETGSRMSGLVNVIASLVLGFVAVWAGIVLAREIGAPSVVRHAMPSGSIRRVRAGQPGQEGEQPQAIPGATSGRSTPTRGEPSDQR